MHATRGRPTLLSLFLFFFLFLQSAAFARNCARARVCTFEDEKGPKEGAIYLLFGFFERGRARFKNPSEVVDFVSGL